MHFNILSITTYGFASNGSCDHNFIGMKDTTENYYSFYIIVCIQSYSTLNITAFLNAEPFVWQKCTKCQEERDASITKAESFTHLLRTRRQQVRLKRRYTATK
jgi:hypothetical protein